MNELQGPAQNFMYAPSILSTGAVSGQGGVVVPVPSMEKGPFLGVRLEPSAVGQVTPSSHHLQDINNILSSHVITTPTPSDHPNPIDVRDEDEVNYTLNQFILPDSSQCLNHAALGVLLEHQQSLSFEKARNVSVLNQKRLKQAAHYQYDGYFAQCGLMTLLEQNLATQVCMCGVKSKATHGINPTGLCNRNRLCYPCANRAARKTVETFLPRFHHHQWGLLTISYDGQLPLTHLSGSEWWLYWDAAKTALKRLVGTHGVDGAMYREELAVPSLSPTTALPHLHAVVPTAELNPEALDRLKSWVVGYRDDLGDGIRLEPSIDFRPVPTEEDFVRVVSYLHKPLDLVTPYTSRWDQRASEEAKLALNRSMRDLIEATIMLPKGRNQIDYCGNMRASSKVRFIGVPRNERGGASKRRSGTA